VHDARPLSCREYYFVHCKARGTGELASLLAEGFEKVRDGEITEDMVDAELERFSGHNLENSTLARNMEYGFWVEMKCVLNMDQANVEGSNSYKSADYQDPIDEKLNRVLSAKYLRSEESYGWKPRDEQLMPYTSGLSFAGSPEYRRIMEIVKTPPSSGLFELGNYPHYVGLRTMVPSVKHSDFFPPIPALEINTFLKSVPRIPLFPNHTLAEVRSINLHDSYSAVLKAYNYLLRFMSHIASLEPILESDPPGTIETDLFKLLIKFENSVHPYLANNPYLEPVKHHMGNLAAKLLGEKLAVATSTQHVFDCLRSLTVLQQTNCVFPGDLQKQLDNLAKDVNARLQKDKIEIYISAENPVETRRAVGKRLGLATAYQAWCEWYGQVLDMRYAALAGFDHVSLPTFYLQAVEDLEKLPLRKSYASCLFDIIKYLSESMTNNNRISPTDFAYKGSADRLASYGLRLFNWQESWGAENDDLESIADFLVAVYKNLGLSLGQDENYGLITHRILASQLADGSWKTDLRGEDAPNDQAEFLETMYRATFACINALRPTKNDVMNPANVALGLI